MQSERKLKIDAILKSSPEKIKTSPRSKSNKYQLTQRESPRSPSLQLKAEGTFDLNLAPTKSCMARPLSSREKESRVFTEKCLQALARKKLLKGNKQESKIQTMMNNIMQKYRQGSAGKNRSSEIYENSPIMKATGQAGYSKYSVYEDKIEFYRMIKSSQAHKGGISKVFHHKTDGMDWKSKPDVTGVRVNNRIIKSQPYNLEGVTCFSLPISESPMLKRHSMMIPHTVTFQSRASSTSQSNRRKVSVNRGNSQKFMVFNMTQDQDYLYNKKLKSFLDFIFKINYSNSLYTSLQLSEDTSNIKKYKAYIGRGNNSLLIKSLLSRRFWIEVTDNIEDEGINFYWTQNKINRVHHQQTNSSGKNSMNKNEKNNRKREPRTPQQKQQYELNKKLIMNSSQCLNVENFLTKEGFMIPYDDKYKCEILTNHVPGNTCIGSKKNLFKSMYHYYKDYLKINPFDYIPKTYHVRGPEDPEFKRFMKEQSSDKIWIVKPGENSNRGNGIKLSETSRVINLIKNKKSNNNNNNNNNNKQPKTYIIQSYITKPFLYNGRKFDIRHYMLVTSTNGILKAYWYKEGYIRTSSQKFTLSDLDTLTIHLTNDAIQKQYNTYEKYEAGNKISYTQFQRYLDSSYIGKGYSFDKDIVPKMKVMMTDVIKANYNSIDKNRKECNFEIFGFDFLLDRDFRPWLIEINFNPCLEMSCPLLNRIIPVMVENSLRLGLDPLMPPLNHYPANRRYTLSDNYLKNLKYEIMFDERLLEETIPDIFDLDYSDDEEQEYCDEGKEIEELVIL